MLNQGQMILFHFNNVNQRASEFETTSSDHVNYDIIIDVMLSSLKYSREDEQ